MNESRGESSAWRNPEEFRAFRDRVESEGAVPFDADVLGRFFDLYRFECAPGVTFHWDPNGWSRCYIKCDHGEWFADSMWVNVTEAFVRARRKWADGAVHLTFDERDDEDEERASENDPAS